MAYCCAKLRTAIKDGKVRFDGKQWHTVSTSVYMLVEMKHCMWCGKALPAEPIVPKKKLTLFQDNA